MLPIRAWAIIAACVLVLIGTASAIAMAGRVSESLAKGAITQPGDLPRWQRQDATPMERYKAAWKGAAAAMKETIEGCRELEKPRQSTCIRLAREQQRVNAVQANARITQEVAARYSPEQFARN